MSAVHDARVREIRTEGNVLYLVCDKIEGLDNADGTLKYPDFKEVEIEYEGVRPASIWLSDKRCEHEVTTEQLFTYLKKKKSSMTMLGWSIESSGRVDLDILLEHDWAHPLKIFVNPTKITYRWKGISSPQLETH